MVTSDLKNAAANQYCLNRQWSGVGPLGTCTPELLYAVARDPDHSNPALDNGDTLTLIFNMKTNAPLAGTKAQIDGLINFGGKSLGTNYTGAWNADANQLVITVVNATGGNLAVGDTIAIKADGTSDLKNQPRTSLGSTSEYSRCRASGGLRRPLYIGLDSGPALRYVTFDPTLDAGICYTLGATAATGC